MQISVDTGSALRSLDGIANDKPRLLEAAGESAYGFLRDYHAKMDWRGPRWMPGANSGEFARQVVAGWQPPLISGDTVTITNTFGLLSWKVTGGSITPKSAQFLTIPLIPTAKGVAARDFGPLFVAGRALCRKVGKQLEAVYALSKGVTQQPWPGALPPEEDVAEAFLMGFEPQFA